MTQNNSASNGNADQEKLRFQESAQEFLNGNEVNKRIRGIIGRQNRFNINMDELRQYNPQLASFVIKDPIAALKMFQDQLNQTIKGM